jgi:hypothetical protein
MNSIKVSCIFSVFNESIIYYLIKKISKKKIEFVTPDKCDLLFIGPYDLESIKKRLFKILKKRINKFVNIEKYFDNLDFYIFGRSTKSLKVFFPTENVPYNAYKADYYISHTLGVDNEKHFRLPKWKEDIDWTHEGICRDLSAGNGRRFGSWHSIEELIRPQGDEFLTKKRDMCIFAGHLLEPRRSFYLSFLKEFKVVGFGPYFDKNIKSHNLSLIFKKDVMKNFAFSLCPENSMFPGWYTEKTLDAFMGKCLPITWADRNINVDFNENAFVNLNDYMNVNLKDLFKLLKDENFLKKYTKEPLLLKRPNLDSEIKFIEMILSNF